LLALLGGTFDPIHLGHLDLARQIRDHFAFSEIAFVPAYQNPLKIEAPQASAEQRLEMLRLAIAEEKEPRFRILDWEVRSPGPSYTIATVEKCLAQGWGPVTLVLGNEVFKRLNAWKEPQRLLEIAQVIVVTRKPSQGIEIPTALTLAGSQPNITPFAMSPLPYSATALRKAWAEYWRSGDQASVPQGTSSSVQAYIKKNRIYAVT